MLVNHVRHKCWMGRSEIPTCVGSGQKGRVGQKPGCYQALPDALWVGVFFPKWVEVLVDMRQTSIESAHWRRMCEILFFAFYGGLPQAPKISSYRRSHAAQVSSLFQDCFSLCSTFCTRCAKHIRESGVGIARMKARESVNPSKNRARPSISPPK